MFLNIVLTINSEIPYITAVKYCRKIPFSSIVLSQDMDLDKGFESYLTAKKNDVRPNAMTFANLLSLTAGFGEQGNASLTSRHDAFKP